MAGTMRAMLRSCCTAMLVLLAGMPTARALQPDKAFGHYVIDTWSIQDGLPQISAVSLAQDHTGYIWVGTQSGLARFDGVRFITYTPESVPALPGIWVRTLLVDRRGRMWIGTYKGLAVHEQGRFRNVPARDARRWPTLDVHALAEQADGTIVAATTEGVFRVAGDRLVRGPGPTPAQSLMPDGDALWVGGVGGVQRLRGTRSTRFSLPATASEAAVTRLLRVAGRPWAGTSQGLFVLEEDGWRAIGADPAFDGSPVLAMLVDRDGNLWVGSNAGLARFRDGRLAEFVPDTDPRAFSQVISTLEDREGNLWLGSQLNGLARVWNGWTRRYSEGEGLHNPIVWSLSPDPDGKRLWVGTNDGLSLFEEGRFRLVVPGKALPHPHAYNLLAEAGQVWVGTRRGLVLWKQGRLQAPPELAAIGSAQINGIVRAKHDTLWVTSSDGLFELRAGTLRRYGQAQGLRDPRVRVLRFLADGRLLLGTQSGLFELRDGVALPLGLDRGLPPNLDVSALHQLRDGRLAIGTLDEKTFVESGGRWHALGPEQGLPANSPFFIDQDDYGFLWLAGIRGISRVPVARLPGGADSGDGQVRGEMVLNERGDANAGQQGYCCNGAGMAKGFLREGVLWLPSRDGVVALDTRAIVKNPLPPRLVIERLRTPSGWRDLPASPGARIDLPPSARDLGFEFTALSFQDPQSAQLRYRLRGYDQAWHRLEDPRRRSANYTNLPPGQYTFEVIGANNAGIWSPTPALLRFRIQPLFQETWLFRALLGALLAALLYAVYHYERQRHARQRAALEAQVQARTLELHAANARLEKVSQTDPLTGLRNRRYLANQIPADIAYYDRERKRTGDYEQVLVFALVDIDHFKRINDMHGHRAGDLALLQAGQVLGSLVRSSDYLARWGGEEFLLVFRPMPGRHLETIGARIRKAVATHPFDIGLDAPLHLTCSVGLSEYPLFRDAHHTLGWEQMVELADAALYWVKHHGRDGWAAFRPTAQTELASLVRALQQRSGNLLVSERLQLLTSRSVDGPAGAAP